MNRPTWTRWTNGHGLLCFLIGCRYPYWHNREFMSREAERDRNL